MLYCGNYLQLFGISYGIDQILFSFYSRTHGQPIYDLEDCKVISKSRHPLLAPLFNSHFVEN